MITVNFHFPVYSPINVLPAHLRNKVIELLLFKNTMLLLSYICQAKNLKKLRKNLFITSTFSFLFLRTTYTPWKKNSVL